MPPPRNVRRLMACAIALVLVGANSSSSRADDKATFNDDQYHFSLTVPAPWSSAPTGNYAVPGTARAAWSGPRQSSIVAFVQVPGKAYSPRFLVDMSAKSMGQLPGMKVPTREVKTVAGKKAMWMVVEGGGNGGLIDGKGAVPTTQQWVAVPREKDIVVVILTCPSADYDAMKKTFESAVNAMTIEGDQTQEQKDAK